MSDWANIRDRYLRDGVDIRLGGLAANLLRIGTLSRRPGYSDIVARLVHESGLFIEWTAKDAPQEVQVELAELQRILSRWRLGWSDVWSDDSRRTALAADADLWSQKVLELSGLQSRGA